MDTRLYILAGTFALVVVASIVLLITLVRSRRQEPIYPTEITGAWPMLQPAPPDAVETMLLSQADDKLSQPPSGVTATLSSPIRTGSWQPKEDPRVSAARSDDYWDSLIDEPALLVRPTPGTSERMSPEPELSPRGESSHRTAEAMDVAPQPTPEPAPQPTPEPAPQPTPEPAPQPTPEPAPEPTPAPAPQPTPAPAPQPTPAPAPQPTPEPAPQPTPAPAPQPSPALPATPDAEADDLTTMINELDVAPIAVGPEMSLRPPQSDPVDAPPPAPPIAEADPATVSQGDMEEARLTPPSPQPTPTPEPIPASEPEPEPSLIQTPASAQAPESSPATGTPLQPDPIPAVVAEPVAVPMPVVVPASAATPTPTHTPVPATAATPTPTHTPVPATAAIPASTQPPGSEPSSAAPAQPEPPEHVLVAPVEMWFGESRVGVKAGSRTYDLFQKYASVMREDYQKATQVASKG